MEPISVPQPLEDPGGQPDRSSPVFNSAVPNVTNLPESVSRNADVQVCLLTLVSSHFPFCLSYSVWFVIHNLCPFITSVGLSIMTRKFVDSWFFFFFVHMKCIQPIHRILFCAKYAVSSHNPLLSICFPFSSQSFTSIAFLFFVLFFSLQDYPDTNGKESLTEENRWVSSSRSLVSSGAKNIPDLIMYGFDLLI